MPLSNEERELIKEAYKAAVNRLKTEIEKEPLNTVSIATLTSVVNVLSLRL